MVLASDREFTVRPAPGTQLTLDLAGSSFTLPIVGGAKALSLATGGDLEEAPGERHRAGDAVADAGRPGVVRRVHAGGGAGLHWPPRVATWSLPPATRR